MFEILDEAEEVPDSEITTTILPDKGDVRFEHVRFGYSADEILIKDMEY